MMAQAVDDFGAYASLAVPIADVVPSDWRNQNEAIKEDLALMKADRKNKSKHPMKKQNIRNISVHYIISTIL